MTASAAIRTGWDALLADGGIVHMRPVRTGDRDALVALHADASDRSIYLRYFSLNRSTGERYVQHLLDDAGDRLCLVAELHGRLVGMASCERLPGTADAEVAMLVADAAQGRGVGTLLLEHLAGVARHAGLRRFVAEVLADNAAMLRVFADAGFTLGRETDLDEVRFTVPLAPTPEAQHAIDARERSADVQSLRHVLAPGSVAVVGASDRAGSVGGALLRGILAGDFRGTVHPVNRHSAQVQGLPAYRSVADLPEPVDLAVVAVPARDVAAVIADCGSRGVPAAVIVTSGFGETGSDGGQAERELLAVARSAGVRLVGPNCLGVASTDPAVRLNATFSAVAPTPGAIGLASQSGALGIALLAETAERGQGVSSFVSLGNKVDVSGNDLLLYWEDDPRTRIIALYLESIGNPRKFLRHAARIARRKPVVALKSGRTAAGSRAGVSHTAAAATPDVIVGALLRQAGVIAVRTTAELLDVTQLLSGQPAPSGHRLGVIGNAGGPGILAADAAADCGLTVPELSAGTQAALLASAPRLASAQNPVDLGAAATAEEFERSLHTLLASGEVDAAVVIYAPLLVGDPAAVATAIRRAAARSPGSTVAVAVLGGRADARTDPTGPLPPLPPLPGYRFAESAVHAIGRAAGYGSWLRQSDAPVQAPAVMDVDAVREQVVTWLDGHSGGGWLTLPEATRLAAAAGVPVCTTEVAGSADEAEAVADRLGYPVVLKAAGAVPHKTEVGGVRLGLVDGRQVREAYAAVVAEDPTAGVVVQRTERPGVEMLVGINRVEPYPPLVAVGLGGTASGLLGDVAVRLAPVSGAGAAEMVRELRGAPLLSGYRGVAPTDVARLEELICRVGSLADEVPEIAELDLNPVICRPDGVVAVDVKVRLAPVQADADLLADPLLRRLR